MEDPTREPIAFFITWSTYGSWLHGDPRGWVLHGRGRQEPNPYREKYSRERMTEDEVVLDDEQRRVVEEVIKKHCKQRGWMDHRSNCRTNHVHTVVTASGVDPELIRDQFKSWATRELNKLQVARGEPVRKHWWTRNGWIESVNNDAELEDVFNYVDRQ